MIMGVVSGQAITLANSIIGVGILAIPFCFRQCGIVLSIVLLVLSGFMSRLACHFLLKSAIRCRRRNFEVLAFHIFGNAGKFFVEIGIIGFLMGTCIAYFVVVGDLGPQIIAKMFNINQSDNLRTCIMAMLTLFCVLPLGLLKNVDSLSNVCAITIGFYFCLIIKIIAEATTQMFTGEWIFKVEYWQPDGVLRCLPIFSMSLFCQTQLFEIYDSLPNASLERMNLVTKNAVTICSVVYVLVGFFGYIAFCNQPISGNILTNLSPNIMSDIIKLGFVLSLAFSFPLIIFPCRVSLYSLLYKRGQVAPHDLISNIMPDSRFKYLTIFIIAITFLISLMLPNIELVLGFVGSTIGVIICVIFPAICFICISVKNTNERILAQILLCIGIVIMVLGTYANLEATETDNISSNNILEQSLEIKHDQFHNENKVKHIYPVDLGIVDKKQLQNDEPNKKQYSNSLEHEKKDSRLEPPNPVAPKDELHNNKNSDITVDREEEKDSRLEPPVPEAPKEDKKPAVINKDEPKDKNVKDIEENNVEKDKEVDTNLEINAVELKRENEENVDTVQETPDVAKKVPLNDENDAELEKKHLLETIKKHEEQQRELVKEQKEILLEIKKTKKEMEEESLLKIIDTNKLQDEESKKIAMKNIKELAKIAIESLGGNFDMLTEKISNNDDSEKKVTVKAVNLMNTENLQKDTEKNIERKDKIQNKPSINEEVKNHIHKMDEPESYKVGEKIENIKRDNILLEKKIIEQKPPIPIMLSKGKTNVINNTEEAKIVVPKELNKNESVHKENKVEINDSENHVGGKRDILVHIEDIEIDRHDPVLHRSKRNVLKCDDNQNAHSEEKLKRNNIDNDKIDVKLSLTLSEPENELKKEIDITNFSNSDFLKYQIRHLQWLYESKERSKE